MKKYIKITFFCIFDKFLIRIAKMSSRCRIDEKVYQNDIFLIDFPFFDKFLIRIVKLSSKCRIDEKVYQNHIFGIFLIDFS